MRIGLIEKIEVSGFRKDFRYIFVIGIDFSLIVCPYRSEYPPLLLFKLIIILIGLKQDSLSRRDSFPKQSEEMTALNCQNRQTYLS